MLVIDVHLLNGRYRATQFDDRSRPEWPPHPARLFYAAVDAVFSSADVPNPAEVDMLHAWESLGAPSVTCSDRTEDATEFAWVERTPTEHFVAGNSATSHRRDVQPHWSKIEELKAAVAEATDTKSLQKASRALEKATRDLATAVTVGTKSIGSESDSVVKGVLELLPENRNKQPRTFPAVTPDTPSFSFTWDADLSVVQTTVLDGVLARITRLGHSSSQVSCKVSPDVPSPTWIPGSPGTRGIHALRTVEVGVLDALRESYARHRGRLERTMHAEITPYRRASVQQPDAAPAQSGIGEWIVLPFTNGKLPLSRTQDVTRAVRGALISHSEEPVASIVSGHGTGDGHVPHIAVLVLPNATNPQSDGLIQAVAVSMPSGADVADRGAVIDALSRWRNVDGRFDLRLPGGPTRTLGEAVFHSDAPAFDDAPRRIATRSFWAQTSQAWSTVTPIALDRHPKIKASADFDAVTRAVAPIVADMCERVGLPRPVKVLVSPAPIWPSVPIVGRAAASRLAFPVYRIGGGDGSMKFTTHVSLTFSDDIRGPIVLGAGRYFGYGLLYPTPRGATP